ncbi:MAG: tetratricopeptide repeat protein, partial [Persicimonas sp.]
MTASEFDKYLRYYRKTLREEPGNIEARLRLAALFREAGRTADAAEAYAEASKRLADEGLPLEAIAACKAVLELEPGRRDVQLFMARMYARVPDATDETARVARPLDEGAARPLHDSSDT